MGNRGHTQTRDERWSTPARSESGPGSKNIVDMCFRAVVACPHSKGPDLQRPRQAGSVSGSASRVHVRPGRAFLAGPKKKDRENKGQQSVGAGWSSRQRNAIQSSPHLTLRLLLLPLWAAQARWVASQASRPSQRRVG